MRLKWGYFGVKSTNVHLVQMGTKPAKVAHRPSWPTKAAKVCRLFARAPLLWGESRNPFLVVVE